MKAFRSLCLFVFSIYSICLSAQQSQITPSALVKAFHRNSFPFTKQELFVSSKDQFSFAKGVLKRHAKVILDKSALDRIVNEKPQAISTNIEINNTTVSIELVKVNLFSKDFKLESSTEINSDYKQGVYYRGIISGDEKSIAAFSFFHNELIGMISSQSKGNITIAPSKAGANETNEYIVYADNDFISPPYTNCSTIDDAAFTNTLINNINIGQSSLRTNNCVRLYYEVDYDIYKNCGYDINETANWMTAVHNNVATIFSADAINTSISEIFVWDVDDPYKGLTASDQLNEFKIQRPQVNGDLGQLVSVEPESLGGVASNIDGLCNDATKYCYSEVDFDYQDVPVYSWTIGVIAHEFGHLLGSFHTHNCSWPGGPIDDCGPLAGYPNEGECDLGPAPLNGGTIMSYCHLTTYGINFSNGFGALPADAIRGAIDNSYCLTEDCADIIPDYCSSSGCTSSEWIQQVSFNSALNYSGAGPGYSDFTAVVFQMPASSVVNFSLTPGYSGTKWIEYFNIWIDFNNDKDFFDKGENVFSSKGSNLTVSGNFTIPDEVTGISRMRISMMFDTLPGNCDEFKYGEVEDYTVNFNQVPVYCDSKGLDASNEWIDFFGFNTLENTTVSDGGYKDFSTLTSNVTAGDEVSFAYSAGMNGDKKNEYWKMWIDYNQDNDFDDDGEKIFGRKSSKKGMLTRKVTIPTTALTGTTRLRLTMKRDETPESCESFSYGEVEDYSISINAATPAEISQEFSIQLYPNPVGAVLNIKLSKAIEHARIQVIAADGRLLQNIYSDNEQIIQINAADLAQGIYFVRVITEGNSVITQKFMKWNN